jgi:hypothetical protein
MVKSIRKRFDPIFLFSPNSSPQIINKCLRVFLMAALIGANQALTNISQVFYSPSGKLSQWFAEWKRGRIVLQI